LPATTPPAIRTLLGRCLQKERKRRLADIADAAFDLDQATMSAELPAHAAGGFASPLRSREKLAWIAAAILLVTSGMLATLVSRGEPTDQPSVRLSVTPPPPAVLLTVRKGGGGLMVPAVSPDGRRVAFFAVHDGRQQLWVRSLDALDARPLAGATGSGPFWSPDSRKIGFVHQSGKLKTIDADGGPVETICDISTPGVRGGWSQHGQHGTIVFGSRSGGIFKVSAAGGQPVEITKPSSARGETAHRHPTFLPDGRRFAFIAWPTRTIWLGSIDGTEPTKLVTADSQAEFTGEHMLFVRDGTLMAQRFEEGSAAPTGEPTPVIGQLLSDDAGFAAFSVSQNGVLAYRLGVSTFKTRLIAPERCWGLSSRS
jgi:eukaryotic-like serine/threonine-protein kinase